MKAMSKMSINGSINESSSMALYKRPLPDVSTYFKKPVID
jgi:hypothetical protein